VSWTELGYLVDILHLKGTMRVGLGYLVDISNLTVKGIMRLTVLFVGISNLKGQCQLDWAIW
jgi:hypothetical protein